MADSSTLIACLMDVERHVSSSGWDQPARLFALVTTQTLLHVEPQLRGRVPEANPDSLTAIEQDEFHATDNDIERLGGIFWPETVEGCAIALERAFLPSKFEAGGGRIARVRTGKDGEARCARSRHACQFDSGRRL